MIKACCLFILISCFSSSVFAQISYRVKGSVRDSKGSLENASIMLIIGRDSTMTLTDAMGAFSFPLVDKNTFTLRISTLGYITFQQQYTIAAGEKELIVGPIVLSPLVTGLKDINISGFVPIKIKEDTTEYNAKAYKVKEGSMVEEVLKKLPGLEVDKDGNITVQGKSVQKVRVNGKDFMDGDVKAATRTIPADVVGSIQLIDDYGDMAAITGIKTTEAEKVLNINIDPEKNHGYTAQLNLGAGSDAQSSLLGHQEAQRYVAAGNLMSLRGNEQIMLMGSINNTNARLLNFKSGEPKSGGPGSSGDRSRGAGGGPNNPNGITDARALGLNYRDSWGKKIIAYGSYSISSSSVNAISSVLQSSFSLSDPFISTSENHRQDELINHRFNFNMEYRPGKKDYLKFSPTINYAGISAVMDQQNSLNRGGLAEESFSLKAPLHSQNPNYGASLLYNHRFNAYGRNLGATFSAGSAALEVHQNPVYSYLQGSPNVPLDQMIYTKVKTDSTGLELSYIEPLGVKSYLEFVYGYHYSNTGAQRLTDTLISQGQYQPYGLLSNSFSFNFSSHRAGINLRFMAKKYNYVLGLAIQPAILKGYSPGMAGTRSAVFNLAPVLRLAYKISPGRLLSINYSGNPNQPSYTELQPVTDYSNAAYPVRGNGDLLPEFINSFSLRYNSFNNGSGESLFAGISLMSTRNKIAVHTIYYPHGYLPDPNLSGTMLTTFTNTTGYYALSGSVSYSPGLQGKTYSLSLNGNLGYIRSSSLISEIDPHEYSITTQQNISQSLVLSPSAKFRLNLNELLELESSLGYSRMLSFNSLEQYGTKNDFGTLTLNIGTKHYFYRNWALGYDFIKSLNYGYLGSTSPNVLNAYLERRFGKQNAGSVRISAYDLFNQNTSFSVIQTGNSVTQTHSNRLGRYYLLTFSLKLQNFKGTDQGIKKGDNMHNSRGSGGTQKDI